MAEALTLYLVLAICLLIFFAWKSDGAWILILLLLLPVRDFGLARLFGGGTLKVGDIFIAAIFGIWLVRDVFQQKRTKFIKTNLDLFLLVLLIVYALSLFWSLNFNLGLVRVVKLARNFGLFVLIREIFQKDFIGSYKKTVFAYSLTSIVIAVVFFLSTGIDSLPNLFALSQKASISSKDLLSIRAITTGGGFLINGPQIWLSLGACLVIGSLGLAATARLKVLKIGLAGVFILFALLTMNRSVIVLLGVVAVVLLWGSWIFGAKNRRKWLVALCLAGLAGGIALRIPQVFIKRFVHFNQDQSWIERRILGTSALDAFLYSPVIGIGPGSNFTWQANYDLDPSRFPDNFYLNVLSETGIIGFVPLLLALYYWLRYLFRALFKKNLDHVWRNIALAVLAFSLGYLTMALAGQELESLEPWIMMGIAAAFQTVLYPKKADLGPDSVPSIRIQEARP